MKIIEIQKMPTTTQEFDEKAKVHESVLRAYNILERVKDLLRKGVPPPVIIELISEMEGK